MKATSPEEIYKFLEELINSQEYEKIADLFESGATLIPPHNQPVVEAISALKENQHIFKQHQYYKVQIRINQTALIDDHSATVRYNWTGDGNMGAYVFDGIDRVQRQPDGNWLIKHSNPFLTNNSQVAVSTGNSENENVSTKIHENSVRYGLALIQKLRMETDLLLIEQQGLTEIAQKLSERHTQEFPIETMPPIHDDIYYKWSEQTTRYYAAAKAVHNIFIGKAKYLQSILEPTIDNLEKLDRPLPEDILKAVAEITQYSDDIFKKAEDAGENQSANEDDS